MSSRSPATYYGVTKTAAEDLCRLAHRDTGLACVVLRSRFFPEDDDGDIAAKSWSEPRAQTGLSVGSPAVRMWPGYAVEAARHVRRAADPDTTATSRSTATNHSSTDSRLGLARGVRAFRFAAPGQEQQMGEH
jgi:dTDP-4-dehydrorhamnose reductase